MSEDFKTVIGLEIHVELNTKSKMFCGCQNAASSEIAETQAPNTLVCPICMGMPGTLPVPNKEAILATIKLGQALNCTIAKVSKFDRKHYFYPDLPKGYQISQYDLPFCKNGKVILEAGEVHLNRVHLEEDAGKLIHPKGSGRSFVDLNRAGTPLVEIVTEPDIASPAMAKEFMTELQLIVRALDVSDADMEKGHLRCDANINVIKELPHSAKAPRGDCKAIKSSPIVEIKNLNSFRFVERALKCEQERLQKEFNSFDGKKRKLTRGFDAAIGKTYELRQKEEAQDYRYFPEPDIPPLDLTEPTFAEQIKITSKAILPSIKRKELIKAGLSREDAAIFVKNKVLLEILDNLSKETNVPVVKLAKLIINEKELTKLTTPQMIDLVNLMKKEKPPSNILRQIIGASVKDKRLKPSEYFKSHFATAADEIDKIIDEVIRDNQDAVKKYRAGKTQVIGFLVGETMRKSAGKLNPEQVKNKLVTKLTNI